MFFGINIVFSLLFYLFGEVVESVAFFVLSLLFLFYFLPYMFQKDETVDVEDFQEKKIPSLKEIFSYIKKGSYYASFSFFYISLYGIAYGINSLHGYFPLERTYALLTLALTGAITLAHAFLYPRRIETIFLIFRSNSIVFSLVSMFFFWYYGYMGQKGDWLFQMNSILPFLWLIAVLKFDLFVDNFKKKSVYILFLFLIVSLLYYYASIYLQIPPGILLIGLGTLLGIVSFDIFPQVRMFRPFEELSRYFGVFLQYISVIALAVYVSIYALSWTTFLLLFLSALFHLFIHYRFINYFSLSFFLGILVFLYVSIFWYWLSFGYFSFLVFTYALGGVLVTSTYLLRIRHSLDLYFLHYSGILFSILTSLYYFVFMADASVLSVSFVLLLQSFLLFASYLRFKK